MTIFHRKAVAILLIVSCIASAQKPTYSDKRNPNKSTTTSQQFTKIWKNKWVKIGTVAAVGTTAYAIGVYYKVAPTPSELYKYLQKSLALLIPCAFLAHKEDKAPDKKAPETKDAINKIPQTDSDEPIQHNTPVEEPKDLTSIAISNDSNNDIASQVSVIIIPETAATNPTQVSTDIPKEDTSEIETIISSELSETITDLENTDKDTSKEPAASLANDNDTAQKQEEQQEETELSPFEFIKLKIIKVLTNNTEDTTNSDRLFIS